MSTKSSIENKINMIPNKDAIKAHILATHSSKEYDDGLIEISHLKDSRYFTIDDVAAAVECAAQWNEQGKNVYIGGSLIDPSGAPFGRSSDADFYAAPSLWLDVDAEHDPAQLKAAYKDAPPTCAVITGRAPYRRTHLWWNLNEACSDPGELRETLIGIAESLGGDIKAVNPCRLMRLGGTIAWPVKSGRVQELTEFHDLRNKPVSIERIQSAYPANNTYSPIARGLVVPAASTAQVAARGDYVAIDKLGFDLRRADGRDEYMSRLVYANILSYSEQHGAWPDVDTVFNEVWPVYERKVISQTEYGLEKEGRGRKALRQKIRGKLKLFEGGRVRGHSVPVQSFAVTHTAISDTIEQVNPETGEVVSVPPPPAPPITARDIRTLDLDNIPPRDFIFGEFAARKFVSLIVAPPGVGKSIFSIQRGLRAAMGESWGDWECKKPLNVWLYNNEEADDELKRRLKGCFVDMGRTMADLKGNLYLDSGENRYLTVARHGKDGVVHTPDVGQIISEIRAKSIDYFIVDPFAETHAVNENSNDEIKQVANLYRRIALETNCAVELIHHTRKGVAGDNDQNSGNADTGRGGGAVVGVVRIGFTMSTMDKREAAKMNVPENERRWFVRLDDAKANIKPPAERTEWLKFKSIDIHNKTSLLKSDSIGVLERIDEDYFHSTYGGAKNAARVELLALIAGEMLSADAEYMGVSAIAQILIAKGLSKYQDRKLRGEIKDAILMQSSGHKVVVDGYLCSLKFVEGRTKPEGNNVFMKKENVSDF